MQIMSQITKKYIVLLGLLVCATSFAEPVISESRLNNYRIEYKDAVTPIKYIFTHEDDSPCCSNAAVKKVYLLDIRQKALGKLVYSPEIDKLFKDHFEVEVDAESLISTPPVDYLVLTMSRPSEYSKKRVGCAAGMGESRAYLVSIAGDKLTVIDRELGGCNRQYKTLHGPVATGYEISAVIGKQKPFTYVLRGDALVREQHAASSEEK
jgi:hypothetical protein